VADETASFAALYARHAADVFRFAVFLCGDRDDADDITSETFSRVWTSSTPIRTESVKAYLMTIARNVYLHERRRQARRAPLPEDVVDARLAADESLEQRDHVHAVRAQLATLKEPDRSAILMHATQDMTYQQIADALGISLASVKIKIFRARLALAHVR
jgi:RNA polymerase sigma-70 factor (ECF subfamily)